MGPLLRDSFLDLERHRQLLQEKLDNLSKSLRHWQLWEAEYEGLKEEILAISPKPTPRELTILSDQYDGKLVTKKEIDDLLGISSLRDTAKIINLIDRRIDYVERNVCTVQKQIQAVEEKLTAASIICDPQVLNEEGLPLTEIIEMLDDEGNVVSSQLSTPANVKPQLLEVLRKAGVKNLPISEVSSQENFHAATEDKRKDPNEEHLCKKDAKKSVSFADCTKSSVENEVMPLKKFDQFVDDNKLKEIPKDDQPIIPCGESEEDAALRRQMLQYSMLEVGSVVAELEIEDNSDLSSDLSEDNLDDQEATDSEQEDAFGRHTGQVVSDELRQRMMELEERMGNTVMSKIHNKASNYEIVQEGIGCITVQDKKSKMEAPKKNVRFSVNIDVSHEKAIPAATVSSIENPKISMSNPLSDVIERTPALGADSFTSHKEISQSQSSNSFLNPNSSTEFGNHGLVTPKRPPIATTIIERETPSSAKVIEPDEMDSNLLRKEVAYEYYKMRNNIIQRQGGFMKESESERIEFTEDEGGPKKMSRFKAARVK